MATEDAALRDRQPWKAAYTKDYGWLAGVVDDTTRGTTRDMPSPRRRRHRRVRRDERRGVRGDAPTPSCARACTRRSDAATSRRRIDRWSSSCGTSRTTGSPTTSPRAVGAISCARSPRRCTGSRASASSAAVRSSPVHAGRDGGTLSHAAAPEYLDDGPGEADPDLEPRRPAAAPRRREFERRHPDAPVRPASRQAVAAPARPARRRRTRVRLLKGAEQALELARTQGWTVVSVKDDWAEVFAPV